MTTAAPMAISPEAYAPYQHDVEQALRSALDEFREPTWLYDPVRYLFAGGGK